jgi:hypothetical protein
MSTDERPPARPCLPWRPEVSCDFLALARVKYVLDTPPSLSLPPPWTLRTATSLLRIWERPDVMPMAYGARAYVVYVGADDDVLDVVDEGFARHLIVVSAGSSLRTLADEVVAGAAATRQDGTRDERWEALVAAPTRPLVDVAYTRPAPGEIVLETDAGGEPAMIHVTEAHHPWWRARVDGRPAPLVRAQRSFMAVPIGPGRHRIDLRFAPPLLVRLADGVTAVAWGLLAAGAIAITARSSLRHAPWRGARSRAPHARA